VYTNFVTNITLSADARLIEQARETARSRQTTLNAEFRRWLEDYTGRSRAVQEFDEILARMRKYVRTGGKTFTREERNARR
jgi:hypothetical protein